MDRGNTKREILEASQELFSIQEYAAHSIFARWAWEKDAGDYPLTPDAAVQMIRGQIHYILHDSYISKAGKCWSSNNSGIRSC